MGLITRAARPDDLLGAADARVASWRGAFTGLVPQDFLDAMDPASIAASWADSIAAGRSRLYVAALGEQVIGYAGVGPERDPAAPPFTGELYALFVHPSYWGTGAGEHSPTPPAPTSATTGASASRSGSWRQTLERAGSTRRTASKKPATEPTPR